LGKQHKKIREGFLQMLSVEKLPPDPPCPPPQLIKEVDLSEQTLLDENNSLPKFSIR
jgi:hypothetical protein